MLIIHLLDLIREVRGFGVEAGHFFEPGHSGMEGKAMRTLEGLTGLVRFMLLMLHPTE